MHRPAKDISDSDQRILQNQSAQFQEVTMFELPQAVQKTKISAKIQSKFLTLSPYKIKITSYILPINGTGYKSHPKREEEEDIEEKLG